MKLSFDDLDETEFEEFCFELIQERGFVNVDWRKGTGFPSSPADRGRDIVAQLEKQDVDGEKYFETWFVDCKHYKRGVPPEAIQGLLTWSHAERPHTALIIASNFLSNPCKDYIKEYQSNTRPPFRIKYWERPRLEQLTEGFDDLLRKHLFGGFLRGEEEIGGAEREFFDRVWYERKLVYLDRIASGEEDPAPTEIMEGMREAMIEVETSYGKENLGPYDQFEWGMINGKLSTLRWVSGDEWDMLDT